MKPVICIIGLGNIGKRHLQAVLEETDYYVYGYDVLEEVREIVKNDYYNYKLRLVIVEKMKDLPSSVDVAIIATSSNVRYQVTKELIDLSEVKNLILEKILFQNIDEYYLMGKIISEKEIKTWVNCPMRLWPIYEKLSKEINGEQIEIIELKGGNWGMACNSIHWLDLINYLSGEDRYRINIDRITSCIESKRKGYYEVFGELYGTVGDNILFSLQCIEETQKKILTVHTVNHIYEVCDREKRITKMNKEGMIERTHDGLETIFQSRLSNALVEQIINTGNCGLIDYDTSRIIHEEYIRKMTSYFNKIGFDGRCPIT